MVLVLQKSLGLRCVLYKKFGFQQGVVDLPVEVLDFSLEVPDKTGGIQPNLTHALDPAGRLPSPRSFATSGKIMWAPVHVNK